MTMVVIMSTSFGGSTNHSVMHSSFIPRCGAMRSKFSCLRSNNHVFVWKSKLRVQFGGTRGVCCASKIATSGREFADDGSREASSTGMQEPNQKRQSMFSGKQSPREVNVQADSSNGELNKQIQKSVVSKPQKAVKSAPSAVNTQASSPGHVQEDTRKAAVIEKHIPLTEEKVTGKNPKAKSQETELSASAGRHIIENKDKVSEELIKEVSEKTKAVFSVVFVSSEVAPYSKTGGLADVSGSLPIALAARGHRVMVVSPRYMNGVTDDRYKAAFDMQCRIKIACFGGEHEVAYFHEFRDGVDWVFVDHLSYHRPGNPYGDQFGAFGDNQFRFTLLCYAACEAPLVLPLGGYTYGQKCLFVVNDWHASLVCVLLSAKYRPFGVYRDARSILLIHNLSHQGVEPATTYANLGLPSEWYGAMEWVFPTWARKHALDRGEAVNHLKGAIVTADRILTVSQGYAWEITTAEGGWGLDELIRSRQFVLNGIINGIDIEEWNPSSDKYIASQYSPEDLSGKAECKAALQKELGLAIRPDVPLIGFIGRLDYQKGIDLIQSAIPELMQEDVQFVMLGSGAGNMESWMKWAEGTYAEKFRGWVGFNVPVSHRITAGCDMLVMPSRFEPCGLNQLYAMRYGTIPIVHCTGGLRDTVQDFDPFANEGSGSGTGWRFSPLVKEAMLGTTKIALETFRNHKGSWEGIMKRGMLQNFSWENAASQYEQIFEWAMIDPPYVA